MAKELPFGEVHFWLTSLEIASSCLSYLIQKSFPRDFLAKSSQPDFLAKLHAPCFLNQGKMSCTYLFYFFWIPTVVLLTGSYVIRAAQPVCYPPEASGVWADTLRYNAGWPRQFNQIIM